MYTDILIPTDGNDHVEPAITYGLDIADRYDATVHALHVVDRSPLERNLELTALNPDLEPLPDQWYDAGDAATQQIAKRAAEHNLDVVSEVRRGVPAREIRSYITDAGIDLVCMGTRGHTGLDRFLLGSVTTRIIRTVNIPVLSIYSKPAEASPEAEIRAGFDCILFPTDGSIPARAAFAHALEVAKMYDAAVHALYVVDRGDYASRPGWTWDELQQVLEQTGETVLEDVRSRATSDGVAVTAEITHGVPHQEISEYCDQHSVDLIVMGTHGRSGISRHLIGSVTERVLRNADGPVLTIRGA